MKALALGSLLVSAIIGLTLSFGLAKTDDGSATASAVPAASTPLATPLASETTAASYAARRLAFAPPGAVEAQALAESTPPTLVGLSRGARTVAFLSLQGQSARLAVGESLQGWRVLAITSHGVVVRRSGRPVRLDLYDRQAR